MHTLAQHVTAHTGSVNFTIEGAYDYSGEKIVERPVWVIPGGYYGVGADFQGLAADRFWDEFLKEHDLTEFQLSHNQHTGLRLDAPVSAELFEEFVALVSQFEEMGIYSEDSVTQVEREAFDDALNSFVSDVRGYMSASADVDDDAIRMAVEGLEVSLEGGGVHIPESALMQIAHELDGSIDVL